MPNKVTIIAEVGVNHNGSVAMAEEMIAVAASAGADVVKFQTFKPELVISRHAQKAEYQKSSTETAESQLEMVRKYELDDDAHRRLVEKCKKEGVEFLSTPFDIPSLELLLSLGVSRFKIPSGEITNASLLYCAAQSGLPVILSTRSELRSMSLTYWAVYFQRFGVRRASMPDNASLKSFAASILVSQPFRPDL